MVFSTMRPCSTSRSILPIRAAAATHVFGLFALIGKRFAPRLRNLKDRQFHPFVRGDNYPLIKRHIGGVLDVSLIREHWDELLRLTATISGRQFDQNVAARN
ncbi:MAG: Tn3 family transposase [Aliidongia sp.]